MKNKKLIGSFYTPKVIADFLVDYLSKKLKGNEINVLEPSAGDGSFIWSIYNHNTFSKRIKKVIAVERESIEVGKINEITKNNSLITLNCDFLDFQHNNEEKFSLVIGNPPYIKRNLLEDEQIIHCEKIHKVYSELSSNKIKNIWTAFLVRCINFVDEEGILALVLPSELLQVKFASELRALILKEFERVEIFTFNELLFKDCKGQDTLLLIGERKAINNKGVFYCNIDRIVDIGKQKFTLAQNINIRDSKWTHHHMTTDEIELLEKIKSKLKPVNYYCTSKTGIVTGANDFFIVDKNTVQKYSLNNYAKKIIQKGSFINGNVLLSPDEFAKIIEKSKPAFLIDLNNSFNIEENIRLQQYLEKGLELKVNERYKASIRKSWYEVPNIGNPPEAFFFKRCNEYPKLIKNDAGVLATDSAYTITMRSNFEIDNLIFSFYNSLSLAFAELYGRYYGGGVLELTPNEFKIVPVPYIELKINEFNEFANSFRDKNSIKNICRNNDARILKSIDPKIDLDTVNKIFGIREKLFSRRMKTN